MTDSEVDWEAERRKIRPVVYLPRSRQPRVVPARVYDASTGEIRAGLDQMIKDGALIIDKSRASRE